ncbi:MAG: hypothetical protein R3B49_03740 [Phycisphaerales bacterium]
MTTSHAAQPRFVALTLAGTLGLTGCVADPGPAKPRRDQDASVAIVDGVVVREGELAPAMREIAGGSALEEHVLGVSLERACREAGVRVTDVDVERERDDLLGALIFEDGQRPDDRVGALEAVRRRCGSGRRGSSAVAAATRCCARRRPGRPEPPTRSTWRCGSRHGERRACAPDRHGLRAGRRRRRSTGAAHAADVGVAPAFAEEATRVSIHPSRRRRRADRAVEPGGPGVPRRCGTRRDTSPGEITPIVGVDARWAPRWSRRSSRRTRAK